jgi:outer membrane protein OmpA-like peptidoglycan-associated protein
MMAGSLVWSQQSQTAAAKPAQKSAVTADFGLTFAVERAEVVPNQCCFWFKGGGADAAVTFWKGFGLAAAFNGDHAGNVETNVDVNKLTFLGGPRYTWTGAPRPGSNRRWQLFGQGLFGEVHGFDGLYPATGGATTSANSFAIQAGAGANLLLTKHFGVRLLEADYVRDELPNASFDSQNDLRLSFGIVYHLGASSTPAPVTLACAATPAVIFAGDPVAVTATAGNLNPKLNAIYIWSGSGVSGSGASATVATGSLAAGRYTVQCGIKEGKPGKEGLYAGESAEASASFTVKPFDPPAAGCSATPSSIKPGETSTVTATGVSPQNRALTYSYAASAGTVSGSGSSATFNSNGAAPGPVSVTCNVTDDKGQTATASTTVSIAEPPAPPAPSPEIKRLETRLALHSVFFPTAQPRVGQLKAGLVASQEGTLTTLAADFKQYLGFKPEAHLTLEGHADVRGSAEYNKALSERRVERTKQFLVENGVPAASIETRGLGVEQQLTAPEVKALIEQNPDLTAVERAKVLRDLTVIVWAQNRRVDVVLSTTGEESVRQFPFNAADSLTLLDKKNSAPAKKPAAKAAKK